MLVAKEALLCEMEQAEELTAAEWSWVFLELMQFVTKAELRTQWNGD